MKCIENSAATASCMVFCVVSSRWQMASPKSSLRLWIKAIFEAVDIYKIMKWKLLMSRDVAGELLCIWIYNKKWKSRSVALYFCASISNHKLSKDVTSRVCEWWCGLCPLFWESRDICCPVVFASSLMQIVHLRIMDDTEEWRQITLKPLRRSWSSVNIFSWCPVSLYYWYISRLFIWALGRITACFSSNLRYKLQSSRPPNS